MDKALDEDRTVDSYKELLKECYKVLPSATPQEPRKGHWEETTYSHHYYNDQEIETEDLRCSCCKEYTEWDISLPHKPYYCENCGTDTRGGAGMTENELRSYNKGVASVWEAIAKVTPRSGDYTLLYNAVNGTDKYPNGFNVKIDLMSESEEV